MERRRDSVRTLAVVVAWALLVAGCGTAASPSPSPTASATPQPTDVATPTPTPAPTPAPTPTLPLTPKPTPTPGPTRTRGPTPRPSPTPRIAWIAADPPAGLLYDVTAGGPGFVIAGESSETGLPAIWASADGISWEEAAVPVPDKGATRAIAAGPERVVAVGCTACGGEGDVPRPAAWTSTDGRVWRLVQLPEPASFLTDVVAVGDGFAAVGLVEVQQKGEVTCGRPAAWISADGRTWRAATPLSPDRCGSVGPLAALGTRRLVAFGQINGRASAWTSSDGSSWEPIADTTMPGPVEGMAAGGPGLVAVGATWGEGGSDAFVSTSIDGSAWTTPPSRADLRGGFMLDVAAWGSGLVAVGSRDGFDGASWTSTDGLAWRREPGDALAAAGPLIAVAADGDRLVAIGEGAWVGMPAEMAP